jgi:Cation efflux family
VYQYLYIDRLLDSSLPHSLIQEYESNDNGKSAIGDKVDVPNTIAEESSTAAGSQAGSQAVSPTPGPSNGNPSESAAANGKVKRTPRALYTHKDETTPLLRGASPERQDKTAEEQEEQDAETVARGQELFGYDEDGDEESGSRIVKIAIYINLAANTILLAAKIVVIILTSSLSVLASLVDAALDFLSTGIIWTTTYLIEYQDVYAYPVGRRRLEPIGVLVFSVIMITSFFQVMLECFNRLIGDNHSVVELTLPAIIIMASTVLIKGLCWFWCRLIKNSSVQALAQDAMTDVVFNTFSIIFPLGELLFGPCFPFVAQYSG